MKIYRLLLFTLLLSACKAPQCMVPLVVRDSISITYKQGKDPIPAFPSKGKESNLQDINHLCNQPRVAGYSNEQPTPTGVIGAATSQDLCNQPRVALDNHRSYEVATRCKGKPNSLPNGGGVKSVKSVESVRDIRIRVDTVFVERWHTRDVLQAQPVRQSQRDGPSATGGLSAKRSQFYKNCTIGFWILIIISIGSIAFRVMRAFYRR